MEGLSKLRGMFAFAIWDARRGRLLLARDRFGKKPLYYAVLPTGIYFGSELSCLRAAGVPLETDAEALRLYFQFSYIPDPLTRISGDAASSGGRLADVRARHGAAGALLADAGAGGRSGAGADSRATRCATVREKFDEAVRIRMIADVPLGAFLSGGIDSSSVVASMALQSPEPDQDLFDRLRREPRSMSCRTRGWWPRSTGRSITKSSSGRIRSASSRRLVKHFDEPFARLVGDSDVHR